LTQLRADGGDIALAAADCGNNCGHQRWDGRAPYNGKVDEGDVVLAMIKMNDSTELPNFGYCDGICKDNKEEFAWMALICDKEYNTDKEEGKRKLMMHLFYDSTQAVSNESESNDSESNELESDESESNESESDDSSGLSFDRFFYVTPAVYMRTHPTCEKDSSEDDDMPPLERLRIAKEEPSSDSETYNEMPPMMPKGSIAHVAWDSDSDSDSESGYVQYEYKNESPYNEGEEDIINEKERPIGQEDWLNCNQEFVFVAHADAEMETIAHPNDNEMPMEEDNTTDEEEYEEEYCLMAKEPAARQPNSKKFTGWKIGGQQRPCSSCGIAKA
jgi:hypothetical protein